MYGGANANEEEDLRNICDGMDVIVKSIHETNDDDAKSVVQDIYNNAKPSMRSRCYEIFDYYNHDLKIREKVIRSDLLYLSKSHFGNARKNILMDLAGKLYTEYNNIFKVANDSRNTNKKCFMSFVPFAYGRRIRKFLIRSHKLQIKISHIIQTIEQKGGNNTYNKTNKRIRIHKANSDHNKGIMRVIYLHKKKEYILMNKQYIELSKLKKENRYVISNLDQ